MAGSGVDDALKHVEVLQPLELWCCGQHLVRGLRVGQHRVQRKRDAYGVEPVLGDEPEVKVQAVCP